MGNKVSDHIHPVFDRILQRDAKEALLNQTGKVIWFTGLSGSGKTTIAIAVEQALADEGYLTQILDGDNIRTGINNNLGFSEEDRIENIRRISEVSKLFVNCGVIALNCFVSPTEEIRDIARGILTKENLIEVYVNTSFEECEARDVKGLYKKARAGEIKNFTGLDAPFEAPVNPNLIVETKGNTVEQCAKQVLDYILPLIEYKD